MRVVLTRGTRPCLGWELLGDGVDHQLHGIRAGVGHGRLRDTLPNDLTLSAIDDVHHERTFFVRVGIDVVADDVAVHGVTVIIVGPYAYAGTPGVTTIIRKIGGVDRIGRCIRLAVGLDAEQDEQIGITIS